jgi:predicted phosphodiesterase
MKIPYLSAVALIVLSVFSNAASGGESKWSFIIVGDSRGGLLTPKGLNVPIMTELADEIVRHKVDFVAFPGDLVLGGSSNQLRKQLLAWREVMEPVYAAGIGVYPVRGNHDLGGRRGSDVWREVFSGRYELPQNGPEGQKGLTYAVEHKNVLLLGLDQFATRHRVDQRWVDEQLENNEKPHVFAFGHLPAFGLQHRDCLDDYPKERNAFWESLKKAGCRIYAAAHDHYFNLARLDDQDGDPSNDVHQLIVGTAGAPLRNWPGSYNVSKSGMTVEKLRHRKAFGYVLVEVMDSEYRLTWHERDDQAEKYVVAGPEHVFSKQDAALAFLPSSADE